MSRSALITYAWYFSHPLGKIFNAVHRWCPEFRAFHVGLQIAIVLDIFALKCLQHCGNPIPSQMGSTSCGDSPSLVKRNTRWALLQETIFRNMSARLCALHGFIRVQLRARQHRACQRRACILLELPESRPLSSDSYPRRNISGHLCACTDCSPRNEVQLNVSVMHLSRCTWEAQVVIGEDFWCMYDATDAAKLEAAFQDRWRKNAILLMFHTILRGMHTKTHQRFDAASWYTYSKESPILLNALDISLFEKNTREEIMQGEGIPLWPHDTQTISSYSNIPCCLGIV